ncbi:hypothetical protein I3760_08G063100 [Carya illinoinensis]|nr:hypothetical protein I3760_08G063100 [Carya illinoinensis]
MALPVKKHLLCKITRGKFVFGGIGVQKSQQRLEFMEP